MRISENKNVHFNARNPKIRFADDIARKVNQKFPRVSATKMEALNQATNYSKTIANLKMAIRKMRFETNKRIRLFGGMDELVDTLCNAIKKNKKGNCGESAELTVIATKANEIGNCVKATMENPYGGNFDHAVVLVKDKKPYIIDAWLGFADYVPNAIKRYQGEFRRYFDFDSLGEKIVIKEEEYSRLNEKFSTKELNKIKTNHPELILHKEI